MHAGARQGLLGPKGGDSLGQQAQVAQQTEARIRVKRGDEQDALGAAVERDGARRIQADGPSSE